jgi:hypothetical protein
MDHPTSSAPIRPPASGAQRLVLAVSAAGAMVTLCWAALQVRAAKDEARLAREHSLAAPAPAPPDLSEKVSDLERRLAQEQSRREQSAGDAAAQIKELEKVITFLRQENEAAQKTIERLSGLERGGTGGPEIQPIQTNTLNKSRDR